MDEDENILVAVKIFVVKTNGQLYHDFNYFDLHSKLPFSAVADTL